MKSHSGHIFILQRICHSMKCWKQSRSGSPKAKRSSEAVANYTALPGNLKKAFTKKQSSGRGSGKDKIGRAVVETRACLACKKVGHLVKDCRNKEAKDAWLAKREKRQSCNEDDDSPRGRKSDRHLRERSDSDKVIEAVQFNDLWWITKAQMCDILLRGGLTVEDLLPIEKAVAEAHYLLLDWQTAMT